MTVLFIADLVESRKEETTLGWPTIHVLQATPTHGESLKDEEGDHKPEWYFHTTYVCLVMGKHGLFPTPIDEPTLSEEINSGIYTIRTPV